MGLNSPSLIKKIQIQPAPLAYKQAKPAPIKATIVVVEDFQILFSPSCFSLTFNFCWFTVEEEWLRDVDSKFRDPFLSFSSSEFRLENGGFDLTFKAESLKLEVNVVVDVEVFGFGTFKSPPPGWPGLPMLGKSTHSTLEYSGKRVVNFFCLMFHSWDLVAKVFLSGFEEDTEPVVISSDDMNDKRPIRLRSQRKDGN